MKSIFKTNKYKYNFLITTIITANIITSTTVSGKMFKRFTNNANNNSDLVLRYYNSNLNPSTSNQLNGDLNPPRDRRGFLSFFCCFSRSRRNRANNANTQPPIIVHSNPNHLGLKSMFKDKNDPKPNVLKEVRFLDNNGEHKTPIIVHSNPNHLDLKSSLKPRNSNNPSGKKSVTFSPDTKDDNKIPIIVHSNPNHLGLKSILKSGNNSNPTTQKTVKFSDNN